MPSRCQQSPRYAKGQKHCFVLCIQSLKTPRAARPDFPIAVSWYVPHIGIGEANDGIV
jgi:hypothetical protein